MQRLLLAAVLAATVLVVYAPVTGYDFIALDDAGYVRANEHINGGFSWAGLAWVLKNPVGGNWHPVTMLSHMADCQLYGLYAGGHHFTNVLLHVANTLLLFWTLLSLMERPEERLATSGSKAAARHDKAAGPTALVAFNPVWPCAFVAALFGLHPLRVESVAWVAERKDVLSGFFFLLTLWSYGRFARESKVQGPKSKVFYGGALLCFALGLMSKPMLVTLPFVLLLLDWWPLKRLEVSSKNAAGRRQNQSGPKGESSPFRLQPSSFKLLLEKLPFFALAALFSVLTFHVQKSYGSVVELKYLPLSTRLANALVSYADYLGKTFWPHPLAMLYPYREWSSGQVAGAALLFGGVSLAAIFLGRRKPYLLVGWFWFAGMLVPVVGLVQVGIQITADRYTYLPSIGLFIALAWGLAEAVARTFHSRDSRLRPRAGMLPPRALAAAGAMVAVALLAVTAAAQVRYWQNTQTLFEHAVRVTGDNTEAHYMLGTWYVERGKPDEAFAEYTQSLRDNPTYVKARCGLGYLLLGRGQWEAAAEQYQAALGVEPDSAKSHFGLAEVYRKQQQNDAALEQYSQALQFDPTLAQAHYQLAALYSARHEAAAAIAHLREAVRLSPGWFVALNNLAWMLATQPDPQLRNGAEARQLALRAAVAVGRNNPAALDTLAAAYAETGRFGDAVQTAQSAIQAASAAGQSNLAAEISSRLKLYQTQQAFRE